MESLAERCPTTLSIGSCLGNLEEGSSTGDFERWMKGPLGLERLFLSLSEEAAWRGPRGGGEILHWDPWKMW